jgi:hypothetical protein
LRLNFEPWPFICHHLRSSGRSGALAFSIARAANSESKSIHNGSVHRGDQLNLDYAWIARRREVAFQPFQATREIPADHRIWPILTPSPFHRLSDYQQNPLAWVRDRSDECERHGNP